MMPLYGCSWSHLMLKMSGSLKRSSSTRPFSVVLKVGTCKTLLCDCAAN